MRFCLVLVGALAASACSKPTATTDTPSPAASSNATDAGSAAKLTLCVYTSEKPSEMFQQFAGIVDPIRRGVADRLKRAVEVELKIIAGYQQGIDELVAGRVDFCQVGPASYVTAKRRSPGIELLAMEGEQGKKSFEGMIIVKKESPIQKLADLKGRRFAFGDANSTIGRYLGQQALLANGIRVGDLAGHEYLGRHDLVGAAVKRGDYDAGALKSSAFAKENAEGKLRVLHTVTTVTRPWVARAGLEEATRKALRESLLALDDKPALGALKISGFLPGADSEYDDTRAAVDAAEAFMDKSKKN